MHTKWLYLQQDNLFSEIPKMTGARLVSNLQPRKGILKKYKIIRDVDQKKIAYHFPDFVINFRQNIQLKKQNNYKST